MEQERILALAFQLGQAIAHSEEMDILQAMQDKVGADAVAAGLIMEYQEAMNQVNRKQRDGLEVAPAELNQLDLLQKELDNNQLVGELIGVQQKFNQLLEGVYFAINQAINGSTCSSDCSSCGGGCSI